LAYFYYPDINYSSSSRRSPSSFARPFGESENPRDDSRGHAQRRGGGLNPFPLSSDIVWLLTVPSWMMLNVAGGGRRAKAWVLNPNGSKEETLT